MVLLRRSEPAESGPGMGALTWHLPRGVHRQVPMRALNSSMSSACLWILAWACKVAALGLGDPFCGDDRNLEQNAAGHRGSD